MRIWLQLKKGVIDAAMEYKSGITKDIIKGIINEVRGLQPEQRGFTFFTAFDDFITKSENRERTSSKGGYLKKTSITKYKNTLAHLQRFNKEKNFGITFLNCKGQLFEKLNAYFVHDIGLSDNTISKILKTLATFLHYCEEQGFIDTSKMPTIVRQKAGTIVSLAVDELFHLYNYDFKDTRLEQARDLFCFQCFTGLPYVDMIEFKKSQIKDGCIVYQRVKTGDSPEVMVPITEWTQSILDRYDELPVINNNHKYNIALKDMAKEAGFNNTLKIKRFMGGEVITEVSPKYEKITSHVGRKTCASVSADLGLERSVTKKILGHAGQEVHDHYRKEQDYNKQRFLEAWSKENVNKIIGGLVKSYAHL